MNETPIQQIKAYLQTHWIPMLGTLILSSVSYIILFYNFALALNNKYDLLKMTVEANTKSLESVIAIHQAILTKEEVIDQKVTDIHDYLLKR